MAWFGGTHVGASTNVVVHGTSAAETINGDAGDDNLFGAGGNDRIGGGAGNDTLYGGYGNDSLNGLDGNDLLDSGVGDNTLMGGVGTDTLVFSQITDAPLGSDEPNTEFAQGIDRIDLGALDAISTGAAFTNDGFTFIGTVAFSKTAGALRYMVQTPYNRLVVEGDVTGDRVADFHFGLTGAGLVLTADDFGL